MQAVIYGNDGENDEDEEESEEKHKDSNIFVFIQSLVIFYIITFNPYNIALELLYPYYTDKEIEIQGGQVTHFLSGGSGSQDQLS